MNDVHHPAMPAGPLPKVSVMMITYNHENFIAQAIESVLMQETDFPIELVIGEDCSTDATRKNVEAFAAQRPDVIRMILHPKNVGAHRNGSAVLEACRGQYIACLEGDDYWTAPDKLQRQVDFLDSHSDHSICGHRIMHVFPDRPECVPYPSPAQRESGTLEDILHQNYLPSCSVVYRAGLVSALPACFRQLDQGDWPMWVLLAEKGRIGFINEVMAHYRVHAGGVWMGLSTEERLISVEKAIEAIHGYVGNRYLRIRRMAQFDNHLSGAWHYNRQGRYGTARLRLLRALACSPTAFVNSTEAKRLILEQLQHYLIDHGVARMRRTYYRARFWAGTKRRHLWNSMCHFFHTGNGRENS